MFKLPHFGRRTAAADIIAGLTTALVNIPQGMAFALIAGVDPAYGLYSGIAAPIIGALTVSPAFILITITNDHALATGSVLARLGGGSPQALFTLTFLMGVILLSFGLLKLGRLTRFISNAVMTGYTAGAALLIILGQLGTFTGYKSQAHGGVLITTWDWLVHIGSVDPRAAAAGASTIALIFFFQRTRLKNQAMILALGASSALIFLFGWDTVKLVRGITEIPRGFPAPSLPDLRLVPELFIGALGLAFLELPGIAGTTIELAEKTGKRPRVSRNLAGEGLANIAGGVFQGMPSGASLSRSAVVMAAGAKTRLANVCAGIFLAVIIMTVGSAAGYIAMPALAGLIILVGTRVLLAQRREVTLVWHASHLSSAAMAATFAATLTIPIIYAIYVGVVLSAALYIVQAAQNICLVELVPDVRGFIERPAPAVLPSNHATVLLTYGHIFFASTAKLEQLVPSTKGAKNAVVILNLRGKNALGSTYLKLLLRLARKLRVSGNLLMLSGVGRQAHAFLERTGAIDDIGRENIFEDKPLLGESTRAAVTAANAWIEKNRKLSTSSY